LIAGRFAFAGGHNVNLVTELNALAERIRGIRAVGRNGDLEAFHIDRSQAEQDARDLADWAHRGHPPRHYVMSEARGRQDTSRTRFSQR
jgi:hypothetical protein